MRAQFKLLDSSREIQSKILEALLPDITKYMSGAVDMIRSGLPSIVINAIQSSPEYKSIESGQLQYELGIPDPGNKLAGLLSIWSSNVQVNYAKPVISGNSIKAKISASMIKADFSDVLYSDFASVQDMQRGYSLPWLEWLLLYGNTTIVPGYSVVLGPNKNSRTGYAVMRNTGDYWKVPSEFAGTISDNWITRALESAKPAVDALLTKALS